MNRTQSVLFCVLAAATLLTTSCSRPEPPRIKPEKATITKMSSAGVELRIRLDAYNPNGIELSAKSINAKLVLDGKHDMGTVNVAQAIKLPAHKSTKLDVPLSMKWSSITTLAALAREPRDIPYVVDGTVQLSGVDFSVPFKIEGTVTHAELVQATLNSLPNIGLPLK